MTEHDSNDSDNSEPQATRREVLAAAGLGVTAAQSTSPLFVWGDDEGPLTAAAASIFPSRNPWADGFDQTVKKYDGVPSFAVGVSDGETDVEAVEDWVGGVDNGTFLRGHEEAGVAHIAASLDEIDPRGVEGLGKDGLVDKAYVEWIDVNFVASYAEPVPLRTENSWMEYSGLESTIIRRYGSNDLPTDGIAFDEDIETTTLSETWDAVNAEGLNATGDSVVVAAIDTGCNDGSAWQYEEDEETHTRILETSKDFTATDDREGVDAVADENLHGSWVSVDIGGDPDDSAYRGIAPGVDLLALRALDDDGQGETANISAAIRYAADQGADVICMSLGSPGYSKDIEAALDYAVDEGVVPVAAVGNDRYGTRFLNYPASSENTIAVTATDTAPPEEGRVGYFPNVGPSNGVDDMSELETAGAMPDLGSPGIEVEAQVPTTDGTSQHTTYTGSSMSAPDVAGAAALLAEVNDDARGDLEETRRILTEAAQPVPSVAEAEIGHGMLDVAAALDEEEAEDDQANVMEGDAETRDATYRAESAARGGWAGSLF